MIEKIGILGGTFDPIHLGHLIVAELVREHLGLDQIIFVPNGNPPHKDQVRTTAQQRLKMVSLAIEGNDCFSVSDFEIEKKEKAYTIDTIKHFRLIYPNQKLFFIIGGDCLAGIRNWYKFAELINICQFAVFPRMTDKKSLSDISLESEFKDWQIKNPDLPAEKFLFVDVPLIQLSSTYLREKIEKGKTIRYLLPEKVEKYINKNNLYKTN